MEVDVVRAIKECLHLMNIVAGVALLVRLAINGSILRNIVTAATSSDMERVFFGVGKLIDDTFLVVEVFECPNVAGNPRIEFIAEPLCEYRVFRYAEEKGLEIVAVIHSHPAPPKPSTSDLKGMRLWSIPWLIVDSLSGSYRAWILVDNGIVEVNVTLTTENSKTV
ncbi:MAG: M67 family metallopeptidase [Ignisphaera sp.]